MFQELVKLTKSGFGIVFSALSGVILLKLIALKHGPEGVGAFGVYRQFLQLVGALLSCGNGFAMIEGYAKAHDKEAFLKVAHLYFIGALAIASLPVSIWANDLSNALFDTAAYAHLFLYSPLLFIFTTYYFYFRYVAAAKNEVIFASLLQGLPFLLMTVTYFFSTDIFVLFVTAYLLSALVGFWAFKEKGALKLPRPFRRLVSFEKTATATLVTATTGYFSLLVVKAICTHALDLHATGLLEASLSIINYVTLIFLTSFSFYYLPAVSKNPTDLKLREQTFILNFILAMVAIVTLILGQDFFIRLLFSDDFLSSDNMFNYMAVGEFTKCVNWFFIFSMIGLSHKRLYMAFDIGTNIIFILAAYLMVKYWPDKTGIALAYFIFQVAYLVLNCALNHKARFVASNVLYRSILIGAGAVVGAIQLRQLWA